MNKNTEAKRNRNGRVFFGSWTSRYLELSKSLNGDVKENDCAFNVGKVNGKYNLSIGNRWTHLRDIQLREP